MKSTKPTAKQWGDLFVAAQDFTDFTDLACWNWMYDSDLFGVLPEKKGEIGYCAVLVHRGYLKRDPKQTGL